MEPDEIKKLLDSMAGTLIDAYTINVANDLADTIITETRKLAKECPVAQSRMNLLYETIIKKLEAEMNIICEEGGGIKVE